MSELPLPNDAPPVETAAAMAALSRVPLFEGLPDVVIRTLSMRTERVSLPAGQVLIRQGDTSTDLYIVRTGRLAAFRLDRFGGQEIQAQIFAGETVGEMAHLTGEPRSATVIALRDCELYRLRQRDLDALIGSAPAIGIRVARVLARRMARMQERAAQRSRPRCFALIAHETLPDGGRREAERVRSALAAIGPTILVDAGNAPEGADAFQFLEASSQHLLLLADPAPSAWTAFCLRQADVHVLMAPREATPAPWRALKDEPVHVRMPEREIILFGAPQAVPRGGSAWLDSVPGSTHLHHVSETADESRVARFLARRATTLVLSGGGARGFAHLGAIRALREAGIVIDAYGGSSMGALIAAAYAAGWPHEEIVHQLRAAFVSRRLLSDPMFPVVALFRGRRVDDMLESTFGGMAIEDLRHPYFCVSTDLSHGRAAIHRRGLLRRWLRASVAVPGILRPVREDGVIHVDGGVIDNLPVEAALELARGPVIGIDVGFDEIAAVQTSARADVPFWQRWLGGREVGEPSIVEVMWRVGTIGNAAQQERQEAAAQIIRPPIADVGFLDWRKLDHAIAIGYEHTMEIVAARRAQFNAAFGG